MITGRSHERDILDRRYSTFDQRPGPGKKGFSNHRLLGRHGGLRRRTQRRRRDGPALLGLGFRMNVTQNVASCGNYDTGSFFRRSNDMFS